tara:strand:+ start:3097 stop:3375 length:279 start_codon:yes stop_codon:yes gene_type:complete
MNLFKKYRKENGLTQQDMSQITGVTQACWSNLENETRCHITIDTIHRIITNTDITFEELHGEYRKGLRTRTKAPTRPDSRTRVANYRRKRKA